MLALLFALRGTVLLYQGEELGLPEVDLRRDQLRDPVGDLYYPLFKGRDGCRTPMPWDAGRAQSRFFDWHALAAAGTGACRARGRGPGKRSQFVSRFHACPAEGAQAACKLARGRSRSAGSVRCRCLPSGVATILCVFNLGRSAMTWSLPQNAMALDFGTGEADLAGKRLSLGPLSAWFGRL